MNKLQQWVARKFLGLGYQSGTRYEIVNGQIVSSPDNKGSYITNGYNVNDIIYSAVNLILDKIKVTPWDVYEVEDESSLKKYRAIMSRKDLLDGDYSEAVYLRKKALTEYIGDAYLNDLLDWPNDYCSFQEFVAESSMFKMLTGDRYIWAETLGEGANGSKPLSLWLLPSQDVTIVASLAFPVKELGFKLNSWNFSGPNATIPKEQVMHDKYQNPNYDTAGAHLYGMAPMKAALSLTDMLTSSIKAQSASFQNGGPKTVLFMDDARFSATEGNLQAQQIKKTLQGKEYGGPDNSNKIAVSGYKMGAVPLGLSPVELGIIEAQKISIVLLTFKPLNLSIKSVVVNFVSYRTSSA